MIQVHVSVASGPRLMDTTLGIAEGVPIPREGEMMWIKNPDGSTDNWLVKVIRVSHHWDDLPLTHSIQLFVSFETTRYA